MFEPSGKPEAQRISGRKFMRTSFVMSGEHIKGEQFDTLFETAAGKYLLIFEFQGRSQQETNELARTMESLAFAK